jgi:RNA polymerase sigma-70 factor, ECF subfamily
MIGSSSSAANFSATRPVPIAHRPQGGSLGETSAKLQIRPHFLARAGPGEPSRELDAKHVQLMSAFAAATQSGDLNALTQLLASDVRIMTDGGGRVRSALKVIEGADRAAKFLVGVTARAQMRGGARTSGPASRSSMVCPVSSSRGQRDRYRPRRSRLRATLYERLYIVRKPDKLRHLAPPRHEIGPERVSE